MNEKRNIQIDIDTAKKWYKHGNFPKRLALQVFTKEELEEHELPKSWDEFEKKCDYEAFRERRIKYDDSINTLERLLMLRDVYRQGWKPDWGNNSIWFICCDNESLKVDWGINRVHLFSFHTKELAEQFLENFRKELEKLKEIL